MDRHRDMGYKWKVYNTIRQVGSNKHIYILVPYTFVSETSSQEETISENLKFILSHFEGQSPKFPRSITTMKTGNQVYAKDEKETLQYFCESGFNDCKISISPLHDVESQISFPSIIHIYLDLSLCTICKYPKNKLDYLLQQTLSKMEKEVKGIPTVLWTGDGYNIILPIDLGSMKSKEKKWNMGYMPSFKESSTHICDDLSEEFMRFSSAYFASTNKNSKPVFLPTHFFVSIPGTNISKRKTKVETLQQWNGHKADISTILPFFIDYLAQQQGNPEESISRASQKI